MQYDIMKFYSEFDESKYCFVNKISAQEIDRYNRIYADVSNQNETK